MYLIIAFFSSIIREFISNPFEGVIDFQNFQLTQIPFMVFVYQYWPVIMHALIFGLVGVLYKRKECPPLGSLLYLVTYVANNRILTWFVNNQWDVSVVLGTFAVVYAVEILLFSKIRNAFVNPLKVRF